MEMRIRKHSYNEVGGLQRSLLVENWSGREVLFSSRHNRHIGLDISGISIYPD
jgi:hypothetical protein